MSDLYENNAYSIGHEFGCYRSEQKVAFVSLNGPQVTQRNGTDYHGFIAWSATRDTTDDIKRAEAKIQIINQDKFDVMVVDVGRIYPISFKDQDVGDITYTNEFVNEYMKGRKENQAQALTLEANQKQKREQYGVPIELLEDQLRRMKEDLVNGEKHYRLKSKELEHKRKHNIGVTHVDSTVAIPKRSNPKVAEKASFGHAESTQAAVLLSVMGPDVPCKTPNLDHHSFVIWGFCADEPKEIAALHNHAMQKMKGQLPVYVFDTGRLMPLKFTQKEYITESYWHKMIPHLLYSYRRRLLDDKKTDENRRKMMKESNGSLFPLEDEELYLTTIKSDLEKDRLEVKEFERHVQSQREYMANNCQIMEIE